MKKYLRWRLRKCLLNGGVYYSEDLLYTHNNIMRIKLFRSSKSSYDFFLSILAGRTKPFSQTGPPNPESLKRSDIGRSLHAENWPFSDLTATQVLRGTTTSQRIVAFLRFFCFNIMTSPHLASL